MRIGKVSKMEVGARCALYTSLKISDPLNRPKAVAFMKKHTGQHHPFGAAGRIYRTDSVKTVITGFIDIKNVAHTVRRKGHG